MRALALVCVWILAGCSSVGGPLDWVLPDELTLGQGSATQDLSGGYMGHNAAYEFEGESESTYAALTWDIPSIKESDGMSRETQRNLSLLIDQMVEEEIEEGQGSIGLTLRDGAPTPPWWLPYGFGAAILLFLVFMGIKSRSNGWH